MTKKQKKSKIDVNLTKQYYLWLDTKFEWIDESLRKYMYRAWCAGIKEHKRQKNKLM